MIVTPEELNGTAGPTFQDYDAAVEERKDNVREQQQQVQEATFKGIGIVMLIVLGVVAWSQRD